MSQSHNIDSLKKKAQVLTAFGCDDLVLLLSLSSGSYICTYYNSTFTISFVKNTYQQQRGAHPDKWRSSTVI